MKARPFKGHKIRIFRSEDPLWAKVEIDGREMVGVVSFCVEQGVGEIPRVTLTLTSTDVEIVRTSPVTDEVPL